MVDEEIVPARLIEVLEAVAVGGCDAACDSVDSDLDSCRYEVSVCLTCILCIELLPRWGQGGRRVRIFGRRRMLWILLCQ
jgi:hypothetical protein